MTKRATVESSEFSELAYRAAGRHVLLDLWGARGLTDTTWIERTLRDAVDTCGATLLNIFLHAFSNTGGVTGVAVIQESHISIHTWPELGYAGVDVFTCGDVEPYKAVEVFTRAFQPEQFQISEVRRGVFDAARFAGLGRPLPVNSKTVQVS